MAGHGHGDLSEHRNWLGLHGGILQSSTMALPGKDGVNTAVNLDFHQLPGFVLAIFARVLSKSFSIYSSSNFSSFAP